MFLLSPRVVRDISNTKFLSLDLATLTEADDEELELTRSCRAEGEMSMLVNASTDKHVARFASKDKGGVIKC
jgi:hypothetical protein